MKLRIFRATAMLHLPSSKSLPAECIADPHQCQRTCPRILLSPSCYTRLAKQIRGEPSTSPLRPSAPVSEGP